MRGILLVKTDFDNMENHNPWYNTDIAVFTSKEKLEEWLISNKPKEYRGWDKEYYPKFKEVEIDIY